MTQVPYVKVEIQYMYMTNICIYGLVFFTAKSTRSSTMTRPPGPDLPSLPTDELDDDQLLRATLAVEAKSELHMGICFYSLLCHERLF